MSSTQLAPKVFACEQSFELAESIAKALRNGTWKY